MRRGITRKPSRLSLNASWPVKASSKSAKAKERQHDQPCICGWPTTRRFRTDTRACEVRADHVFDEIFDIADDGRNDWMEKRQGDETVWVENGEALRRSALRVDARKWALARMQPKKYGDKITHEGTGPEGEIVFKTVYHAKDG